MRTDGGAVRKLCREGWPERRRPAGRTPGDDRFKWRHRRRQEKDKTTARGGVRGGGTETLPRERGTRRRILELINGAKPRSTNTEGNQVPRGSRVRRNHREVEERRKQVDGTMRNDRGNVEGERAIEWTKNDSSAAVDPDSHGARPRQSNRGDDG